MSYQMSQGRKGKNRGPTGTRAQGLSQSKGQLSSWANGRLLAFSYCLIGSILGSARNNRGPTRHTLFDAPAPSVNQHWATKCQREEKIVARQGLSLFMRQLSFLANGRPLTLAWMHNAFSYMYVYSQLSEEKYMYSLAYKTGFHLIFRFPAWSKRNIILTVNAQSNHFLHSKAINKHVSGGNL